MTKRVILLVFGISAFFVGSAEQGKAASAIEACYAHASMADAHNCIGRLVEKQAKNVRGEVCSAKACLARLSRTKSGDYSGSGYYLSLKDEENGVSYKLKDHQGRTSEFFQCFTCGVSDYKSGPLKEVLFHNVGVKDMIISISR